MAVSALLLKHQTRTCQFRDTPSRKKVLQQRLKALDAIVDVTVAGFEAADFAALLARCRQALSAEPLTSPCEPAGQGSNVQSAAPMHSSA